MIDWRGLPEAKALLESFQGQPLQNRVRRGMRAGAAVWRRKIRSAGNAGWPNRPATFNKTRTRPHRTPIGISVSPQSPLSNIFEGGAKPHAIPIGKGPLAGATVHHPGVAAQPFLVPIFDSSDGEATDAAADVIFADIR